MFVFVKLLDVDIGIVVVVVVRQIVIEFYEKIGEIVFIYCKHRNCNLLVYMSLHILSTDKHVIGRNIDSI